MSIFCSTCFRSLCVCIKDTKYPSSNGSSLCSAPEPHSPPFLPGAEKLPSAFGRFHPRVDILPHYLI